MLKTKLIKVTIEDMAPKTAKKEFQNSLAELTFNCIFNFVVIIVITSS